MTRRLLPDDGFDLTVSGLMLNFVPEPERAVAEMARVTRPRGPVAVYVWDYAGGMDMLRTFWDAAAALDPAAGDLDEARRFGAMGPETLTGLFSDAGLRAVETLDITVATPFAGFDDYWTPFLGARGRRPRTSRR